jgi:ATP-dependent DNA helicase
LLDKSVIYSGVLKQHMDSAKLKAASEPPSKPKGRARKSGKRLRVGSDSEDGPSKRTKTKDNVSHPTSAEANASKLKQPALITGTKLKGYQLEGVEWMISLDQNGISGILGTCSSTFYILLSNI